MIMVCIASFAAVLVCVHEVMDLGDQIDILNRQIADLQKKIIVVSDDFDALECSDMRDGRFV